MVTTFVPQDGQPSTVPLADRGMMYVEGVSVSSDGRSALVGVHPRFWGPIIGGSLFACSVFVLSWFLMMGCHVGVTAMGVIALGSGAAIWLCVTAAVAFYCGGRIAASGNYSERRFNLRKGLVLWGLTIPLGMLLLSLLTHGEAATQLLRLPQATIVEAGATGNFGMAWATFIGLGVALIFALLGSLSGKPTITNHA